MKLKEEISLVIARYTTKIIKDGNVDPSLTFQILDLIENKIDSIERFPAKNEYQVAWNKGVDDTLRQLKELLK